MGAGNSGLPPTPRRPGRPGPNNEAGEYRTGGGNAGRHGLRRMDGADPEPLASLSERSKHIRRKKKREKKNSLHCSTMIHSRNEYKHNQIAGWRRIYFFMKLIQELNKLCFESRTLEGGFPSVIFRKFILVSPI